jgi:hypothetical protein
MGGGLVAFPSEQHHWGVMAAIAWFLRLFSQGWLGLFAGLMLTTVAGLLGWLGWKGWQNWRYRRYLAKLPAMESLYRQMLDWLEQKGCRKHPTQTPLEFAHQVWQSQPTSRATVIEEISTAYMNWRYGGQPADCDRLKQRLQTLKQKDRRDGHLLSRCRSQILASLRT